MDTSLRKLYGSAEPFHLGTKHPWALGGPDPLDGISIYQHGGPLPHWHYISYGMSELYEKSSPDPETSGWGFEFTFRLVRRPNVSQPPMWPAALLQQLGRYVFDSGKRFKPGHTMRAGAALATDRPDSAIRAMAFTIDSELGRIATPHGDLQFLQIVGLTDEEYRAALGGNCSAVLDHLAGYLPLHVTDVDRGPLAG
ncbi:suppressor of fused domain protein [Nocardia flavorosea]|uniref:Suppressor of fused domain protein n=2 Tax=Nocardia flavorosea TaxID=53429 RepID=A0A846Y9S2_9NOCA|nr:suppressor of fused domain protein [Nocardia flavorosea]